MASAYDRKTNVALDKHYFHSFVGDAFLSTALIYDRKLSDSTLLSELKTDRAFSSLSAFYQINCSFLVDWVFDIEALLSRLKGRTESETALSAINTKFPILPAILITEYVVYIEHKASASPIFEFIAERAPSIMRLLRLYSEMNEQVQRSIINNIEPSASLLDAFSKLTALIDSEDTRLFVSQYDMLKRGYIGKKLMNVFYPAITLDDLARDSQAKLKRHSVFYDSKILSIYDLDYINLHYGSSASEMIAQTLKNDTKSFSTDFDSRGRPSLRNYMVSNIETASLLKYNIYNLYRLLVHSHEEEFKRSIGSKLMQEYISPSLNNVDLEMFVADIYLANKDEATYTFYVKFYILLKLRAGLIKDRERNIEVVRSIMDDEAISIGVRMIALELWFSTALFEHYLDEIAIEQFAIESPEFIEKLEAILRSEFTEMFMIAYSIQKESQDA